MQSEFERSFFWKETYSELSALISTQEGREVGHGLVPKLPSATKEQVRAAGWLPFLSLTFHGSFLEIHDCMFLKRIK